ncbi:MAG: HEAT repeat domain-containing protein, partial [Planctomycetes bacterium]|nr:HEAT repeat domain-containing protein [Planctomycetota bacterium]
MISSRRLVSWLLVLSWLPVGGVLAGPPPAADLAEDESVLQAAGVPTDSPGLLEYFRKQTLTAAEQERLQELIQRLGDRSFRVREQALLDLIQVGPPALPPLRQALQEDDPEIQRRAGQAITSIERQAGPSVVTAAVHLLEARRPAEASAVLLDYLPLADPAVEDEILAALSVLGVRQGRVDAALAAALNDPV